MTLPTEILLQIADKIRNTYQQDKAVESLGIQNIFYGKKYPRPYFNRTKICKKCSVIFYIYEPSEFYKCGMYDCEECFIWCKKCLRLYYPINLSELRERDKNADTDCLQYLSSFRYRFVPCHICGDDIEDNDRKCEDEKCQECYNLCDTCGLSTCYDCGTEHSEAWITCYDCVPR